MRELYLRAVLHAGPVFAPPILVTSEGLTLCQTAVIVKYLAKRFGLCPPVLEDEARADMISACVHDFIAEGRSAFHPGAQRWLRWFWP